MIVTITQSVIRSDEAGDGHFGSKRGDRIHEGVDYLCRPGGFVFSPVDGVVSKLGYAYSDDLGWRFIEVKDDDGNRHRLFYCSPLVSVGQMISYGEVIGSSQNITMRYKDRGHPLDKMLAHVHYEIISSSGDVIDPEKFGE